MSYSLSNSGYGMRDEELKAYLDQGLSDSSGRIRQIAFLENSIKESHGTLEYQSKIGHGISFTINLTKSIISP